MGEVGRSTIDYVITNEKAAEEIRVLKEGDRTESDHLPLEVQIEGPELRGSEQKQWVKVIERSDWTEEGIGHYHLKSEGWFSTEEGNDGAWNELKNKVKESIKKNKLKITPWRLGKREWHSKEWKRRKRELRRVLRNWKKGKVKNTWKKGEDTKNGVKTRR